MTNEEVNRMRRCFGVAAIWNDWSEQDQAEIGAEIRAASETNNAEALDWWAQFLEEESGLAHLSGLCRAAETRIKCAAELRRRKAA